MSSTESVGALDTRNTRANGHWERVFRDEADAVLTEAIDQISRGQDRAAVGILLERANSWMHRGQWSLCRELLSRAEPEVLGVTAALGVLAAVYPIRERTRA